MKERLNRECIAMRVARELFDGAVVNLGIGLPTLVSKYKPEGIEVIYHSENGVLNFGPVVSEEEFEPEADIDLLNAGGEYLKPVPGMSFFNTDISLSMIRGGHIDIAVLGAIEISEKGDLANWMLPGRNVGNIGGGMDLAFNVKRIICATEHTAKNGKSKIVKQCSVPLTAPECVDLIVTDIAVIEVTDKGLLLKEVAPGWTTEDVQALTEPRLIISPDLTEMTF